MPKKTARRATDAQKRAGKKILRKSAALRRLYDEQTRRTVSDAEWAEAFNALAGAHIEAYEAALAAHGGKTSESSFRHLEQARGYSREERRHLARLG